MKIKTIFFVAACLVVGLIQAAKAITFPATAGLFIYDTATGQSTNIPIVSGVATYNGGIGDWTLAISAGVTYSNGSAPFLTLSVPNAVAGAGATSLQFYYSDVGFGPTTGSYTLSAYPATGGPVTTSAWLDTGNGPFGQSTFLGSGADIAGQVVVDASGTLTGVANPYSLTISDVISGNVVSLNTTMVITSAPEPSSVALMCVSGLTTFVLVRRRR